MRFMGFKRPDGTVGVRNYVVVVSAVLCADVVARKIAAETGAVYIYNPHGCAQTKKDTAMTLDILTGLIANGNVYGALIVGLGCEIMQKGMYMEALAAKTSKPVRHISIQELGGVKAATEAGIEAARELIAESQSCVREECDLSDLVLGLECGGSDPTSGISANAVLGKVTDRIIDAGGSAFLSETPEALGAEHILRERGKTREIGEEIYHAILDWERDVTAACGEDVRSVNPSPGNKAGGLTTLAEKSLGCIHKAGTSPFSGCFSYGQLIREKGLFFIDSTAYDVVNVVALVAAGATIVAFTTGRGNPVGNPIAPVLKITGNSYTASWLSDMIDLDTSASITEGRSLDELGEEMLARILDVAGGAPVKAELNGASEIGINQNYSYV